MKTAGAGVPGRACEVIRKSTRGHSNRMIELAPHGGKLRDSGGVCGDERLGRPIREQPHHA